MTKYLERFKQLNTKRQINLCCEGNCFNNYISEDETLVCGRCEKEKHLDMFVDSVSGYLCDTCEEGGGEQWERNI